MESSGKIGSEILLIQIDKQDNNYNLISEILLLQIEKQDNSGKLA